MATGSIELPPACRFTSSLSIFQHSGTSVGCAVWGVQCGVVQCGGVQCGVFSVEGAVCNFASVSNRRAPTILAAWANYYSLWFNA